MHDVVIRGGTIVDGTGAPAFTGDVAVDGSRIASVDGRAGPARRDIDATGMLAKRGTRPGNIASVSASAISSSGTPSA